MKNGAVYGALLRRLNLGIKYVNWNEIDDEVKEDTDDIKEVVSDVWKDGLARRINESEYELICDVEQMRSYIQRKDCIKTGENVGEYDDEAEKPISFGVFSNSNWSQVEIKTDASKGKDIFSRYRESSLSRSPRRRSSMLSAFSDWDDDERESDEERQARIKEFIERAKGSDMEKRTFEPYMDITLPDSDKKLLLGWYTDNEGDYVLNDNGIFFE